MLSGVTLAAKETHGRVLFMMGNQGCTGFCNNELVRAKETNPMANLFIAKLQVCLCVCVCVCVCV